MPKIVLITGSPIDGFSYYGPTEANDPDLEEFIENECKNETWWYGELAPIPAASVAPDNPAIAEELGAAWDDYKRNDDADVDRLSIAIQMAVGALAPDN